MINRNINFEGVSDSIKQNKIVVVDNFLEEDVAEYLRERMLRETYFHEQYKGYRAINYFYYSDPATQLLVDSIHKEIPVLDKFQRAWSFIYENKCEGVDFHADPSIINLNIWVSRNESVNNFQENGLIICGAKPPADWERALWNGNKDNSITNFLEENKPTIRKIEYRYNRAIFFDGSYFHKTDNVNMKDGDENRRVSYTMLFGTSLNERSSK